MNDHITLNGGTLIKDCTLIGANFVTHNNFAQTPQAAPCDIVEAEEAATQEEQEEQPEATLEDKIRLAIRTMQQEGVLKHQYDYLWPMLVLNKEKSLPHFDTPKSFLQYLRTDIGLDNLPSESTLQKKYGETHGEFPQWTFRDTDDTPEVNRRNNVGRRFLNLLRQG